MIETSYRGIPADALNEAADRFSTELQLMLCAHQLKHGAFGTIASAEEDDGGILYWVEPKLPGDTYPALRWHLSPEGLACTRLSLPSDVQSCQSP